MGVFKAISSCHTSLTAEGKQGGPCLYYCHMMDYVDFKTIHTISKNNNDKVHLCFISFFINRQSCACIDDSRVHQTLKDSLWYLMWLPFIPHFLNRLLTEASQSQIETCSKVFSIKPALKATELTKVFASCTWSPRASELIADNFFRVMHLSM